MVALLGALALAAPAQAASGKFVKTTLVDDSLNPMELDVAEDGRVFYIERWGDVRVWDPETEDVSTIGHINVYTGQENGLMGLALAPDFSESNQLYLAYSVPPAGDAHAARLPLHAHPTGRARPLLRGGHLRVDAPAR